MSNDRTQIIATETECAENGGLFEFLNGLMAGLYDRHARRPVTTATLPVVQSFIDNSIQEFDPSPHGLAEGCAVTGLRAGVADGALMFRWRTAFLPQARYPVPHVEVSPLGFWKTYDLCVLHTEAETPSLRALFGPGKNEYADWNLADATKPEGAHADALGEAMRRAELVNALWGTAWASPSPMGSIGLPVRLARGK